MIYAALKTVHVLAIIVWMGGMVFAHFFLRPAVAQLEAPVRLRLMHDVLGRFFQAVLVAALLTLASGVWMLGRVAKQVVQSGAVSRCRWPGPSWRRWASRWSRFSCTSASCF
jgi:uncharacterized membrane protein